jgi:hypothetical protein
VVNNQSTVDFIPLYAQITPIIPSYNAVSNLSPLSGCVELLVNIAIEAEGYGAHIGFESEVSIPFL